MKREREKKEKYMFPSQQRAPAQYTEQGRGKTPAGGSAQDIYILHSPSTQAITLRHTPNTAARLSFSRACVRTFHCGE